MGEKGVTVFLEDFFDKDSIHEEKNNKRNRKTCRIFCWNIRNPSLSRARKQALWLRKMPFDVLILTETKNSAGCSFLEQYFGFCGYHVFFPKPGENEYGTMIISRFLSEKSPFSNSVNHFRARVVSIRLVEFLDIEVIGTYAPSRDASDTRKERKHQFLESIKKALELSSPLTSLIFCGDFNILEPNHIPHYSRFESWEYDFYNHLLDISLKDAFRIHTQNEMDYSWVGRTGDGYRFDHCFVSHDLAPLVAECYYLHEPRNRKLSDHSGIVTTLETINHSTKQI